jgi:hypothetical protein
VEGEVYAMSTMFATLALASSNGMAWRIHPCGTVGSSSPFMPQDFLSGSTSEFIDFPGDQFLYYFKI